MIKKILIIYIEGYENPAPKQEKNLLQSTKSRRVWDSFFKKVGFYEGLFKIIPKTFVTNQKKEKYYKILDRAISNLFTPNYNEDKEIKLKLIITGDHDEVKLNQISTLEKREEIANEIFDKYKHKKNIAVKIILERNNKFKLESIMSEIIGEKINKNLLRKKIEGNEYPNIIELMNFCKHEISIEEIIGNLINSKHPLFKEINK